MIAGLFTALLLVVFIGCCVWAWSPARKQAFDEAARIPLDDDTARKDNKGNAA